VTFTRVCSVGDVDDDGTLRVMVGAQPICVVRTGGRFSALLDRCSHADVALSEGDVEDGQIECWLHGSTFDLATGEPNGPPALRPVPVYETKTDGDDVLVDVPSDT
jgi:3-phenylpropionate/trans-cinnamate dioxygenase ferredoxin component